MPGIVGFTLGDRERSDAAACLVEMRDLLAPLEFHVKDPPFVDDHVAGSRVSTGIIQHAEQPHASEGLYTWIDGELFNRGELAEAAGVTAQDDPGLLAALYRRDGDFGFLDQVDGMYAAVVYDAPRGRVHLLIDRHGLRHLYWTAGSGRLAWASECKAFLRLRGFEPKIDRAALDEFTRHEFITGDRTWFEGVQLLPAGTVLTWDLRTRKARTRRYWQWSSLARYPGRTDVFEVADELGRRFRQAVRSRVDGPQRIGIFLSGGLDSRAILAACPETLPVQLITFGRPGCDDIRIATDVARLHAGATHHVFELGHGDWLAPRLDAIWRCDAQTSLMHMHSATVLPAIRGIIDVNLSGFLGDATIGGSYQRSADLDELEMIERRGRRRIISGLRRQWSWFEARAPFFDNDFLELAMGLPAWCRTDSFVYQIMLLRTFPEFFTSIPWKTTGRPISAPGGGRVSVTAHRLLNTIRRRGPAAVRRLRQLIDLGAGERAALTRRELASYEQWLRVEPARSFIDRILRDPAALYPEYIERERVVDAWDHHLAGGSNAALICRFLTAELWLQQVFNGRYRTAADLS